ncbi:MAG: hypothetical protein V3V08_03605 [Nannocystaceae bacterium]
MPKPPSTSEIIPRPGSDRRQRRRWPKEEKLEHELEVAKAVIGFQEKSARGAGNRPAGREDTRTVVELVKMRDGEG